MRFKTIINFSLCAFCLSAFAFGAAGCANRNGEVAELKKQVEQLQERIDEQSKVIEDLKLSAYKGNFYSLEEAFEKGYIQEEQIKCVSYYAYGKVFEALPDSEEMTEVDFVPVIKEKPTLIGDAERYIRNAYFNKDFHLREEGGTADDLKLEYYGRYNGEYYVVTIDSEFWSYPARVNVDRFGNTMLYNSGPYFQVFVYG